MKWETMPPWLSEMEQSAGWSRLVCSRQWRVKEITPGLWQQPWPCSQEHNEGGHAWPAGEKEGGSRLSIFHRRQTDCCMLFYKPRSMSMTETFQWAAGCGSLGWKHTPRPYWKGERCVFVLSGAPPPLPTDWAALENTCIHPGCAFSEWQSLYLTHHHCRRRSETRRARAGLGPSLRRPFRFSVRMTEASHSSPLRWDNWRKVMTRSSTLEKLHLLEIRIFFFSISWVHSNKMNSF